MKKYVAFVLEKSNTSCSLEKHSWFCRERKLMLLPLLFLLNIFFFTKNIFVLLRLAYYELLYFAHLRLRFIHDNLYQKNVPYKKVNDFKYTRPIRRASIMGFVLSFIIFQIMGTAWPEIFNPIHPRVAEGGSNSVTWTTDADFNTGTTQSSVKVANDSVTLSDPSKSAETKNFGYTLKKVYFPSTNIGYALDSNGILLKTTNAGVNWTEIQTSIISANGMHFVSNEEGYITSNRVLKTADGGVSWTDITPDMGNLSIYGVYFKQSSDGYVVGQNGKIMKYNGSSWTDVSVAGFTSNLNDVTFSPDGSVGTAVSYNGNILRTTDGSTWSEVASGVTDQLTSVHFTDASNGFIGGGKMGSGYNGRFLKTDDGGLTWTTTSGISSTAVNGIHFTTSQIGFAVGRDSTGWSGQAYKTTNGGTSWTSITLPAPAQSQPYFDVHFADANNGYIVGQAATNFGGIIFKTADGGATWTKAKDALKSDLYGVHFLGDGVTGYACGSGLIVKTTDGGSTWGALTGVGSICYDVYFTDVNNGYALVSGKIYKTINGGASWTGPTTITGGKRIHFISPTTGYVAGGSGKLYRTVDSGGTWVETQIAGMTSEFYDITFFDAAHGYAIGYNGEFAKTENGGDTWTKTNAPSGNYYSVFFTGVNNGYIVGYNVAKRTADGGATWSNMTGLTNLTSKRVFFTDENNGFIATQSRIYYTTDGGSTWNYFESLHNNTNDIYLTDQNSGIMVGPSGFVGKIRSVYPATGTISGFTVDVGEGAKANWTSVTNNSTLPANTLVSFQTRGSDDNVTWSGWQSLSGETIQTAEYRYLEVKTTLSTSDGLNTPTLSDFTVTYDNLEAPVNGNITLTKTDGTALKTSAGITLGGGVAGGWTNATALRVTATGLTCGLGTPENPTCSSSSTNRRPEVEIKEMGTPFDGVLTYTATSGNSYVDVTLPGVPSSGQGYHIRVRAIDDEGKVSGWTDYASDAVAVTYDNAAPGVFDISTPTNNNWSVARPTVTWTGASDANSGVNKYQLYIDGTLDTDNISPLANSVQATGSLIDGAHTWYVKAVDNAGNTTQSTSTFTVNVDTSAPTAFGLSTPVNNTWTNDSSPDLTWAASSDPHSGLQKYQLYINGNLYTDNISSASTSTTPAGPLTGTYTWFIRAINNAGGETSSPTYTLNYDNSATFPSPFAASNNDAEKVVVSWTDQNTGAPTDTFTVHRVRKQDYDGNSWTKDSDWSSGTDYGVFTVSGGVGVLNDSSLGAVQGQPIISQSVNYVYKIKSTDTAGNVSGWSGVISGRTTDTADPQDPSTVTATACDGTVGNCSPGGTGNEGFEIKLAWAASNDFGSGVTGYKIYRKHTSNSVVSGDFTLVGYLDVPTPGAPISTIYYDNDANNDATYTDTINEQLVSIKGAATERLNDYVNYYYRVVAVDAVGNETDIVTTEGLGLPNYTNYATVRTPDVTPPIAPQNLVATPMGLDSSGAAQRVDLAWDTPTDTRTPSRVPVGDGSGIAGYKVLQCQGDGTFCSNDGNYSQIGTPSSASHTKEGLGEFTQYYYKIIAVDRASSASIADAGNNNSARSGGASVMTASNTVPTVPLSVNVATKTGDPNTDASVGHQNTISFNGSYAKNCAGGERCITGYEIYRSTDNFASNSLKIADVAVSAVGDERAVTYSYTDNDATNDATSTSITRSAGGSPSVTKAQTAHLDDATTYYYKVKAKDNTPAVPDGGPFTSGLSAVTTGTLHAGWDTTPDDTPPDVPQNVAVKDIHPNDSMVRNIITWSMIADPTRNGTSDFRKYQIYRYETLLGIGATTLIAEKTNRGDNYHVDGISEAEKDKDYSYYVVAVDNAGSEFKYVSPNNATIINTNDNKSANSGIVAINPGSVNPTVGGVTVASTGVSSATVNWTTNQIADSLVEYRVKDTNDVLAQGKDRTQPTTNHSVVLGNLSKGTQYQYRVISRNSLGNIDEDDATTWRDFTTLDFTITNPSTTTTTTTAVVKWDTNTASDSYIEYKLEKVAGEQEERSKVAGDSALSTSHEVSIQGLKSNRTYTYKIRSVSSDKFIAETTFMTFKTRADDLDKFSILPAEASVSEKNITATTAQITWVTTASTTSWVEYGTETGVYSMSAGDNDFNTLHVVRLTNLVPGTKYYYRVKGKDENSIEVFSPESSFTAILMPEISNLRVREFSPYTATITFDTNVDTVVSLNYGKDEGYGSAVTVAKAQKNHVVTLKDLDDNSTYYFQASATDQFKNNIKSAGSTFSTPLDTQGPEVSELKVDVLPVSESSETASVIISWTTDKPSTTQVQYDDKGSGEKYDEQTTEDTSLNTSHTVMIKDLNTSANYRYQIVAKDKRGNLTKTKPATFITPTKEKSLIQIIIKSLEDTFSWAKNVPTFFGKVGDRLLGK